MKRFKFFWVVLALLILLSSVCVQAKWSFVSVEKERIFNCITAYGKDRFLAGGNNSISVSGAGIEYEKGMPKELDWSGKFVDGNMRGIAYNGAVAVAAGDNGKAYYSTDMDTWTAVGISKDAKLNFISVDWCGTYFSAVGYKSYLKSGTDNGYFVYTSKDGKAWSLSHEFTGSSKVFVTSQNNRFLISDPLTKMLIISDDGISFLESEVKYSITDIYWDGRQYLCMAEGNIYSTYDFKSFNLPYDSRNNKDKPYRIIKFNNDYYVMSEDSKGKSILFSWDGMQKWTLSNITENDYIDKFVKNEIMAYGISQEGDCIEIRIYKASDDEQQITFPFPIPTMKDGDTVSFAVKKVYNDIRSMAYNSGRGEVIGIITSASTRITGGIEICPSKSKVWKFLGSTWSEEAVTGINQIPYKIMSDGERYVIESEIYENASGRVFNIYASSDVKNWEYKSTIRVNTTRELKRDMFYAGGKYFITGDLGELYCSDNLETWETRVLNSNTFINAVASNGSVFVAVGDKGTIYSSTDAVSWQAVSSPIKGDINDILYNGKYFIAAGDGGAYLRSTDGNTWTTATANTGDNSPISTMKIVWDGIRAVGISAEGPSTLYYPEKNSTQIFEYNDCPENLSFVFDGEYYMSTFGNDLTQMYMPKDLIKVKLNGVPIAFDVAPQAINNRTMLPARIIMEKMGATVSWEQSTQTVTVQRGDTKITMQLGLDTAYVNGVAQKLDQPAVAVNGRTLVPLRFLAEALSSDVSWDGDTYTVSINA